MIVRRDNREREAITVNAEQAARLKGYGLVIRYAEPGDDLSEYVEELARKQVSGVIIDSERKAACGRLENTAVYLNQTKEFDRRERVSFYYRLSEAGRIGTERLIQEGHHKIACIAHRRDRSVMEGCKMAVQSHNLPLQPAWFYEGENLEAIEKYGIRQCLTEEVTAVICGSPEIAERRSIVRPAQDKLGEKIIVVGSMNMDVTLEASRIPVKGETQIAEKLYVFPGGKGANRAVGAGKLGGQVYMIGCLGNDMDGRELYTSLVENHVHMDGVLFDTVLPSGKAYINVDQGGESTIVVYQGANRSLNQSQIQKCRYLFESAAYCLLSMEIPDEIVEYTIRTCRRTGTEVILKPSATEQVKEELYADVSYFIPNENELHLLVPGDMSIEEKAELLRKKGVKNVIVTLGARGCYLANGQVTMYFEGSGFEAVDTTGGADSFISALAVCLSEGKPLVQAVRFAIYASGITVTRYGVQPALPDRRAVDVYEDEIYGRQSTTGERT